MSKSKKKKRNSVRAEEKEALRQERAELAAKQNRRLVYLFGGVIICVVILIAALMAPFNAGKSEGYTYGQYQRIETGMSYQQVTKLLGGEGETVPGSSDAVQTYIWSNEDGSNITITFTEDKVSGFNQKGLSE